MDRIISGASKWWWEAVCSCQARDWEVMRTISLHFCFVPSEKAVLSQGGVDCSRAMCYQAKLNAVLRLPWAAHCRSASNTPLQGSVKHWLWLCPSSPHIFAMIQVAEGWELPRAGVSIRWGPDQARATVLTSTKPSHEAQYKGWWPSGLPTARLWGDAEHFSSCFAWLASPHRLAGSVEAGWTELSYLLFTLPSICKAVSESLMGLFDSVWFNERSSELQAMLWVLPLALGKSIIINLRSAFFPQYVFLWACSSMRISFKRQSHS